MELRRGYVSNQIQARKRHAAVQLLTPSDRRTLSFVGVPANVIVYAGLNVATRKAT